MQGFSGSHDKGEELREIRLPCHMLSPVELSSVPLLAFSHPVTNLYTVTMVFRSRNLPLIRCI
jgi:hypothetical protein